MASGCTQESSIGTLPTTLEFRPDHVQIEVIRSSRQVVDFDKVGQSTTRPNANRFYLENGFGASMMVQLIVGVKDSRTNEFWNCNMKNKQRKIIFVIGNNGTYSIEVDISPNGLVSFPQTDQNQNQLPDYLRNVKCVLPVEGDEPIIYNVKINLYKNDSNGTTLLHYVQYFITTNERNHDVFDFQEGRNITEIERPQLKIKMTGIIAKAIGKRIKMYFQNLGDNGMYQQFYREQRQLLHVLKRLGERFGPNYYKDLELYVMLEECSMLFGQAKLDECYETAMRVLERVMETNTPNGPFLLGKVHYVISAIYRRRGDLQKALEHIVTSTELLEPVEVCEETAVNQYNWAALYAEKSTKTPLSICEKEETDFRFENTQLHWKHQTQNNTNRGAMKAQIRKINYHLVTSRQRFPDLSKQVPKEDMVKAAQAIQHVECNLLSGSPERHHVTYSIAKSDDYIRRASISGSDYTSEVRRRDAETAVSILESTLAIAEKLGLPKEIEGIEDRLHHVTRLLETNWFVNQAHDRPYSSMATAPATRGPVEQDAESVHDLLEELESQSPELAS